MRHRILTSLLLLVLSLTVLATAGAGGPGPRESGPGSGAALGTGPAEGELLAAFRPWAARSARLAVARYAGAVVIESSPRSGVVRLRVVDGDIAAAQRRLLGTGLVRIAEPNARLRVAQSATAPVIPTDPRYPEQAWYWELVGGPEAWAATTGSRSVVVALIDGAVDLDHPDFAANIWSNSGEIAGNGVDDDGNGFIDDLHGWDFVGAFPGGAGTPGEDSDPDAEPGDPALGDGEDQDGDGDPDGAVGHGTRVAGILAAAGNNDTGIAGVAWEVAVMPLRVTSPEGDGFFSSFIRAMEYAIANGAQIVNISLASAVLPETAREAVEAARDAGLILVGAAGNSGLGVTFPAADPAVIAVGAHAGQANPDGRASFSPRQPGVDLVAPGVDILTTDVAAGSGAPGYSAVSGTSFATPFVSGAAALLRALNPALSPADVRSLLTATADDLPDGAEPSWDGAGRLRIDLAVARLQEGLIVEPAIDSVSATATEIIVAGTAEPRAPISVIDQADGNVLGSGSVTADGSFQVGISRAAIPETTAQLTMIVRVGDPAAAFLDSSSHLFAVPHDVVLFNGWNLVAWPGADAAGADVLASMPAAVRRVFAWRDGTWDVGVPGSAVVQIPQIRSGQGMWVWVESRLPVVWRRARVPRSFVALRGGWQLVAWPAAGAAPEEVAGAASAITALWGWDALQQGFVSYRPQFPAAATLARVWYLQALWVRADAPRGPWPAGFPLSAAP